MKPIFEELDFQTTRLGDISLRRRSEPRLDGRIIHEVKLGDEFLMSSLFTEGEIQLAHLGLSSIEGNDTADPPALDVVVGGLGLGYTAAAVLEHDSVRSLSVIEVMEPVIQWHLLGLLPLGKTLARDTRCTLVQGDFFKLAMSTSDGFDRSSTESLAHAILLDIDHSPKHWLNPGNAVFYSETGLSRMAGKLRPGGVFGLWSDDPPDRDFCALLALVFDSVDAHIVVFPNPYTGSESTNTVYLARNPPAGNT